MYANQIPHYIRDHSTLKRVEKTSRHPHFTSFPSGDPENVNRSIPKVRMSKDDKQTTSRVTVVDGSIFDRLGAFYK